SGMVRPSQPASAMPAHTSRSRSVPAALRWRRRWAPGNLVAKVATLSRSSPSVPSVSSNIICGMGSFLFVFDNGEAFACPNPCPPLRGRQDVIAELLAQLQLVEFSGRSVGDLIHEDDIV